MATTVDERRIAARIKLVEQHVRLENAHDLEPLMETFGQAPTFDLNHDRIDGHTAIHAFYAGIMEGFPDFHAEVKHRHVGDEAIVMEVVITGTHRKTWNGIPPAGRTIEVPVCVVFPFDADERLAGERIYFDMALMLQQLGVMSTPEQAAA